MDICVVGTIWANFSMADPVGSSVHAYTCTWASMHTFFEIWSVLNFLVFVHLVKARRGNIKINMDSEPLDGVAHVSMVFSPQANYTD
jgi:hypothetical protein